MIEILLFTLSPSLKTHLAQPRREHTRRRSACIALLTRWLLAPLRLLPERIHTTFDRLQSRLVVIPVCFSHIKTPLPLSSPSQPFQCRPRSRIPPPARRATFRTLRRDTRRMLRADPRGRYSCHSLS